MSAPHSSCRYAVVYGYQRGDYDVCAVHDLTGSGIIASIAKHHDPGGPMRFASPIKIELEAIAAMTNNYESAIKVRRELAEEDRRAQ